MVRMYYSSNHEEHEKAVRRQEEEQKFYDHLVPTEITQVGTLIETSNVRRN
jgi:hypothetical protein